MGNSGVLRPSVDVERRRSLAEGVEMVYDLASTLQFGSQIEPAYRTQVADLRGLGEEALTTDEDATAIAAAKSGGPTGKPIPYLVVLAGSGVGEMFKVDRSPTVLGRSDDAHVRLLDDGISRRHAILTVDGESVAIADLNSMNGTFRNGERVASTERLADGDKLRIGSTTILKFSMHDEIEAAYQQAVFDKAQRDGMTGAFRQKYFYERLNSEYPFAKRHATCLAVVFVDLDNFKALNDRYGHPAGDAVLVGVAKLLQSTIRAEDLLSRYGGEEFAILCRGITGAQAVAMGQRLRNAIRTKPFVAGGNLLRLTASIGVAAIPDSRAEDAAGLVRLADEAVYAAKAKGRDRVEIA